MARKRLRQRARARRNIAFAYDLLNRVTAKTYPNGGARSVHYGYDLRSLQLFARFDSAAGEGVANSYDGFGRLVSHAKAMAGTTRTLAYLYDANSNRTRITHPDGNWFRTDYDGLNRPVAIWANGATQLASMSYAAHGGIVGAGRANGATSSWGYDGVQRPASLEHGLAGTAQDVTWTYGYNAASQLGSETRSNDFYAWTGHYGANRNYTTNGLNQYSAAGPASFGYDANGNLTSDGARSYGYDIENRLTSASGGIALAYDPLGRLHQTAGGAAGTTTFLYDGDALVAEHAGAALLRRHVHNVGADVPLFTYEGATLAPLRSLHADRLGSIVATADAAGNAIALNAYDEYGIPGAANIGRFQYTGQIWLPELGMYHYKARIYSPTLGRFLQVDPIAYEDQFNLYSYVRANPLNLVDKTGKKSEVVGQQIRITPWDRSHPAVTIPVGRTGARGVSERDRNFHRYNVSTSSHRRNAETMGNAIASNPTPGNDRPATAGGAVNNVGSIPLNGDTNYVQSFRVPSPDPEQYTDITVNYTISGEHGLNEGFVMRYGEIGEDGNITINTYGEGNAWEQNPILERFWGPSVQQTWKKVDDEVLRSARPR